MKLETHKLLDKDLMSLVLKKDIECFKTSIDDYSIEDDIVRYWVDGDVNYEEINLYKFFALCTSLLFGKGFTFDITSLSFLKEMNITVSIYDGVDFVCLLEEEIIKDCYVDFLETVPLRVCRMVIGSLKGAL